MADLPDEVLEALRTITTAREEFVAEMRAEWIELRARLEAEMRARLDAKEEALCREMHAAYERKKRAVFEEIDRLRCGAAAVRDEGSWLQ